MKRFWLFQCNEWEPIGGLSDLDAIGDDIEELKCKACSLDEAWIVDTRTWTKIVIGHKRWPTNKYNWKNVNEPIEILQGEV